MTSRSRDDVVRAAGRLFAERGFHGTSMRDLGSEVGLVGSSLYSHVAGKSELLVEVVRRGAGLFQDLADEVTSMERADPDVSATDQLMRLIEGHIDIVAGNLDEARTILNEARFLGESDREPIVEMRDRYEGTFRAIIDRGVRRGEFGDSVDSTLAAIQVLSLLNALERWYRPDGPQNKQDIATAMVRFILRGIERENS